MIKCLAHIVHLTLFSFIDLVFCARNHPELKYVETGIHGGNEAGKSGINMMKSIVFVFQS